MNHSKKITTENFSNQISKWFEQKGDQTLRIDYPELNENSIVFDIGGYHGDWANDIHCRYKCTVYVFEPVFEFYEAIAKRFEGNDKVKCYNFGLSSDTRETEFILADNATSEYFGPGDAKRETVNLVNIMEFIQDERLGHIDLVKVNIEGEEYALLERLSDYFCRIGNLQVQYHSFVENCDELRESISNKLKSTHRITYCFDYIWENWKKI